MRLVLPLAVLLASCAPPPVPQARIAAQSAPTGKTCEQTTDPVIPPSAPANSTWVAAGKPIPERFRGAPAGWLKIQFMSAEEVNRVCASQPSGLPVCGRWFYACTKGDKLIMSNPCDEPGAPDDKGYAGTLCHEIAHVNGWPATHGD